jgi:predicted thioesterase
MNRRPASGHSNSCRFQVEPQHLIDFASSDMPAVLSTPWLIKWLEQTAREALRPFLQDGEASVGTEVDIRHLAPTPLGSEVTCVARVISAEGNTVYFQVEASDGQELVARGVHRRAVISQARFLERVKRKLAARS